MSIFERKKVIDCLDRVLRRVGNVLAMQRRQIAQMSNG